MTGWMFFSSWLILICGAIGIAPSVQSQDATRVGDDFYRPHILTGTNPSAQEDTRTATAQPSERPVFGGGPYHSVWWSWRPPETGLYSITTHGSNFDTTLGVSVGEDLETLVTVASNDDDPARPPFSLVKFIAYPSTNYLIRVDGNGGATGAVNLQIKLEQPMVPEQPIPRPPVNDHFTNRTVLVGMNPVAEGSNAGATPEEREARHAGLNPMATVWWKWTPPTNGLFRITTEGSDFDTILAVYGHFLDNPPSSYLLPMAANDDAFGGGRTSEVVLVVPGRTNIFIAAEGYAWTTGRISLRINLSPIPSNQPNDRFEARLPLEGNNFHFEWSNIGATVEPEEPAIVSPPRASVWWRWRATESKRTFISVTRKASTPVPAVMVFTGDSIRALTPVPRFGPNKPGVYAFEAVTGTEYAIGVDSLTSSGVFNVGLVQSEQSPVSPLTIRLADDRSHVVLTVGPASGNVVLYSSEDFVHWQRSSTNTFSTGESIVIPIRGVRQFFYVKPDSP